MIRRFLGFFLDILQVIVFAAALFLFIYLLILQPHKIKGNSMFPSFLNGEFLLTDKVSYRVGDPKRGDVVVFQAPPRESDEYIKRIIGLPGETVAIRGGHVYINGKLLSEPYLDSGVYTSGGLFLNENQEYVVPENQYFVMGDNRPGSSDSRSWGPVIFKKITGRAWIVYWPFNKSGKIPQPEYNI